MGWGGDGLWWPGEGIRYPGIKITDCFVLPDVGPENPTLVLWKSSTRSKARHSPVPFPTPMCLSVCLHIFIRILCLPGTRAREGLKQLSSPLVLE